MNNLVYLIGRLTEFPKQIEEDTKTTIKVAVTRPYKNTEGIYETDIIECILWNNIANKVFDYCKKGDLVGIKGRIQTRRDNENSLIEIITEKITFLSSKKDN